jgi:NADH:ubiquinone oxidoreductase subunit E
VSAARVFCVESLIAHYKLDDIVTLKGNFCFERCSDGVTVMIGEKTFRKVTGESIVDLFEKEVFSAIYGGK